MQFILGNFGAGKTSQIKKEVISLIRQQKQVLLIVPSRRHKDQLLLELLKEQKSLVGNPVLTLTELQRQITQHLFSVDYVSLSNFEKFLTISSICSKTSDQLKSFKNIKNRPELLKMVYRLIQSLREKDIEHLQSTPELQDKIHDIQLILTEYHQYLQSKNLTDPKLEIDLICQSPLDPTLLPDNVFIDGFVDFTATQFKLIQHIANQLKTQNKNITITLTDTPHTISQQTLTHFREAFPLAKVTHLQHENDILKKDLEFYEIQAFGKSKEVEYIVNQIKNLCITQNYTLDDILLVTNRQDQYTPILMSALRKAEVPFAFGKDDKLSQNPLILFIKRALKLMTESLNHETLEFLSQSNYVKEEYQLLWGKALTLIPFAVDGRQKAWEQAFQQIDSSEIEDFDTIKSSIMELCQKFVDPYQKQSIDEIIQYVVELIDFFGIQEELTKTTPLIKHKKIIELSIAKDYSALLKLKDIISELQNSLDQTSLDQNSLGEELSLKSFLFFFNIITEETRYRSEIPQKNVLRILTPNDTRGIFVKAVFVLGLNEGEFPSAPRLELFDNFDRSQLNALSKKILGQPIWDTDIDYFDEQKLAFDTVLSRATDKIYFSRTPVNEKGVYFNCSYFLQRILERLPSYTKIPHTDSENFQNPNIFQKRHNPEEYFELSSLTQDSILAKKAYEYTQNINLANDSFDREQLPEQKLQEHFGYIPNVSHVTQKYTSPTIHVSPTSLERVGRCRYRGLWQDFWKLKSYSLPSYRPEATDYGNLYHQVLERYIPQNDEFDPTLLHKILQECIDESTQMYLFTLDYHFLYLTLSSFLLNIQPKIKTSTKFVELSSGEGELSHNVVALTPQQSLIVHSRVDRVDYDDTSKTYSVIDYKKGSISAYKEYQATPFNLFQGFLYSELLRNNDKAPIRSVSYIFLERQEIFEEFPNISTKKTVYQSIHEFQDFKLNEINRLITLLGEGNFSPFTFGEDIGDTVSQLFEDKFGNKFSIEHKNKCKYCDLQDLCPRRQKLKTQSY